MDKKNGKVIFDNNGEKIETMFLMENLNSMESRLGDEVVHFRC